jgi:hypothetical protein
MDKLATRKCPQSEEAATIRKKNQSAAVITQEEYVALAREANQKLRAVKRPSQLATAAGNNRRRKPPSCPTKQARLSAPAFNIPDDDDKENYEANTSESDDEFPLASLPPPVSRMLQ